MTLVSAEMVIAGLHPRLGRGERSSLSNKSVRAKTNLADLTMLQIQYTIVVILRRCVKSTQPSNTPPPTIV